MVLAIVVDTIPRKEVPSMHQVALLVEVWHDNGHIMEFDVVGGAVEQLDEFVVVDSQHRNDAHCCSPPWTEFVPTAAISR